MYHIYTCTHDDIHIRHNICTKYICHTYLYDTAREASYRRAFDPYALLLFILYHYLEQNLQFGWVPEPPLVLSARSILVAGFGTLNIPKSSWCGVWHVYIPVYCRTLSERHCNTPQHTATHCNTLQHTVSYVLCSLIKSCNTLQHTATHCNTLQHTVSYVLCSLTRTVCKRTPLEGFVPGSSRGVLLSTVLDEGT